MSRLAEYVLAVVLLGPVSALSLLLICTLIRAAWKDLRR